jgi:TPR repeat protein
MKKLLLSCLLIFPMTLALASAAVSLPTDTPVIGSEVTGAAKLAMDTFKDGRHVKAVELAKPLAEEGNTDALYLLGFAHETGQGLEASREKALGYYRKAADGKHKDSIYRLSFILLASEDKKEREQARVALETAAKDDPAVAGRILGEAFLRGLTSEKPDAEQALFWWQQASNAGDIPSLLLVARLYEGQFGFPEIKDSKKALETYSKAAGLGNPGAMVALGSRLLNGPEADRNEKEGRTWLKKAIEAKELSAFLALGDYEENVKKNLKAALVEYERGKDAGQVDCMLRTAQFYMEGKGTEKDEARGLALLENAAKGGSAVAHFTLAVQKLSGDDPDAVAGYGHLVSAATGGLVEAQNELGLLYLSGKLSVADPAAGVAWLTRAAQGGFAQAQNNLGALYEQGAGVPQNFENAGQLYALAANQGHGPATFALARMHFNGTGTEVDPVKAWAFAALSDEREVEEAKALIKDLESKMDEKQLAEAKKYLEDVKSGKVAEKKEEPKTDEP